MKCKKQYACLHTHTTAFGLMGADTLTGSLSSLSGPLASQFVCARMFVPFCLCVSACLCVCARMCLCDPSGGSHQPLESSLTPWQSQTHLHWNGRVAGPLYGLFAFALKASTAPLVLTHKCMHAYMHIHTHMQSHIRYMGINFAAAHTVGFPNCYSLFRYKNYLHVCVYAEFRIMRAGLSLCKWGHVDVTWLFLYLILQFSHFLNDCCQDLIWSPPGSHQLAVPHSR